DARAKGGIVAGRAGWGNCGLVVDRSWACARAHSSYRAKVPELGTDKGTGIHPSEADSHASIQRHLRGGRAQVLELADQEALQLHAAVRDPPRLSGDL